MFTFGSDLDARMSAFIEDGGGFYILGNAVTLAYMNGGPNLIRVAVAHCNPNDVPNPAVGVSMALQHYMNGNTVLVQRSYQRFDDQIVSIAEMFAGVV